MDPEDIVAEVRMERQQHRGSFLLLEGKTDISRFRAFLHSDCSVVNCWGKETLMVALTQLDQAAYSGLLALADADFDRILNIGINSANLIYSESHDFDLDCALSPTLDLYLAEVANPEKLQDLGGTTGVLQRLLQSIRPISCARLANQMGQFQAPLSDTDWEPCYTPFGVNIERYIERALRKTSPTRQDIDNIVAIISRELAKDYDIAQITNGHDFCSALGISLRDALGTRARAQSTGKEVELHLRLAYRVDHFFATETFRSIRAWESRNSPYRVIHD